MAPNTSRKYDLKKFDGSNDFSLWRIKMRAVLIQQGLLKALKGNQGLPDTMSTDEKEDMLERAHIALNRFATYRSFDGGKVLMGNDVTCKVVVIGSIHIRMHDGIVRTLTDVRHVPELKKNLISLGTLDFDGCSYQATCGVMWIMKGALVVMKGLKQNSLYLLQGSTVTGAAATTSSSDINYDTTKLWHIRLGHMSERGMDVLSKQGLLGSRFLISRDVTFDESSMLSKKKELTDAGKYRGVREKVELELEQLDVKIAFLPGDLEEQIFMHQLEGVHDPG
ncbi:hypothetical protein RJ639_001979 [Escallonia herrerae]|uniref:GAG-pre-integrase domain-containing protein n=1 Tax=Escallonia herrerae TaxID=1293975 RepID=A0AA88XRR7_9ASTE|nr:hypothetical protein RJ639_001979 [Escallonia herrerae]